MVPATTPWGRYAGRRPYTPGRIHIVDLAGNVGSYNDIMAGMTYATSD